MRNMLTIVCALAILVGAGTAFGVLPQNQEFNNASGDSLWMTANNWLAEDGTIGAPNDPSDDNAWIGSGLTCELRSTTVVATPKRLRMGMMDGTAGTLKIYDGAHLDLTLGGAQYGYVACSGAGVGDGHVIQYGGTFTTCGFGLGRDGATGTWDLQGGTISAYNGCGINLATGRDQSGSTGILTQTGGTINFAAESGVGISLAISDWVGNMHDDTAVYTISGGTLNMTGAEATDGAIGLGPTNENCTGNKATYHVIGAWDTGVDNILANAFRMSAPGDNQATLICDIDGALGIEKTVVANAATFDGTLEVNTLGAGHAGTYTLMTYASATGDFDTTDLPGGWTYNIGATDLTVTVPEPATLTLLGLGGLGVLIRRKRR